MKKILYYLVLFLSTILLCADTFAQTIHTGVEAGAVLKASALFQNFKSTSPDEVFVGNSDLSSFHSTDVTWGAPPISKHISFAFNGSTVISSTVNSAPTNISVPYTFGATISPLNYFEILLKCPGNETITFNNASLKIGVNTYPLGNFSATNGSTTQSNITGLDLSAGFTVEGDLSVSDNQGGDAFNLRLRFGYFASADIDAPVASNPLATPDYAIVGTDIALTANIDDSQTGNSNIKSAEYSLDGTNWNPMSASDGSFNEPTEDVIVTLSGLTCGEYQFCIRGYDFYDNMSNEVCGNFSLYNLGSISGIVDVGGNGVGGVIVILYTIDLNLEVIDTVSQTFSEPNGTPGYYEFTNLLPLSYRVGIVTPIGFSADAETKDVEIPICDNDETVNFTLTAVPIVNAARSKGYWKNQFDYYIKGKGHAQESLTNLNNYIAAIGGHYIPHFSDIFEENYNMQYWSDILSYGGPDMYQKAKSQLAALILNMASLKISQMEVVTADGNDVADVITHASTIMSDAGSSIVQLELAKDIAEAVCNQVMIAAGLVPDYNILYKHLQNSTAENLPIEYALYSNYPNPFNPSTVINYAMPREGFVTLKVYDLLGKEVVSLVNEKKEQGLYSVNFNASKLAGGVYFYRLQVNDFTSTKKMLLLK